MIRNFIQLLIFLSAWGTFVQAEVKVSVLEFSNLQGWKSDTKTDALTAFLETCPDLKSDDWAVVCAIGQQTTDADVFFSAFFKPIKIETHEPSLITGYFEPELPASRVKTERFLYPIYRKPPELPNEGKWLTRADIENSNVMENRGLEIAWLDDPVDLFFLQVQGSGRLRMQDGTLVRVGYAAKNGHKYRSVGKKLVAQGIYNEHQVSASVIKNWVKRNPVDGRKLLLHNESYVFFRKISNIPNHQGPKGAMNRSSFSMRSIAVDPAFIQLGAPVWMTMDAKEPLNRLMIAQDTGSVIKGAQRADIFVGSGSQAGKDAGRIKNAGSLYVLLPIKRALALSRG